MVMTIVTVVGGRMVGGSGWIDGALGAVKIVGINNLRRLVVPGVLVTGRPLLPSVVTRSY